MCNSPLTYLGIVFLVILGMLLIIFLTWLIASAIQETINNRDKKILHWITEEKTRNEKLDSLNEEPSPEDDYNKTKTSLRILENCLDTLTQKVSLLDALTQKMGLLEKEIKKNKNY